MRDIERKAARSKQTFASEKYKVQASKQNAKCAAKGKAKAPAITKNSMKYFFGMPRGLWYIEIV